MPIQPKTSNIMPKFCQQLAATHRVRRGEPAGTRAMRSRASRSSRPPSRPAHWWDGGLGLAKFGKISKLLQIFGGLVLGCIKTKFCKKICVWQHFSRSTRFAYFFSVSWRCRCPWFLRFSAAPLRRAGRLLFIFPRRDFGPEWCFAEGFLTFSVCAGHSVVRRVCKYIHDCARTCLSRLFTVHSNILCGFHKKKYLPW